MAQQLPRLLFSTFKKPFPVNVQHSFALSSVSLTSGLDKAQWVANFAKWQAWVQNRPPALSHLPHEHITGCCPQLHWTDAVSPKIITPRHNSWVLVCNDTDQVHLSSWIQSQTHSRSRGYCPYMCTMVRVTGSFPGWSGYFQRKKIGKFERKFPLAHNTSYKGSKQSMFFSTTHFLLWIHRRTCIVAMHSDTHYSGWSSNPTSGALVVWHCDLRFRPEQSW